MSIASEISRLQTAKAAIKAALENKGVTVSSSATLDDYADYVDEISGGGGGGSEPTPAEDKSVKFIDYDGTLLYSYTPTQFAALTALPENPTHTGLVSQGWNWNLANAKTHVAKYKQLNIGQQYVTDDGKTRLYITINDLARSTVTLSFQASKSNDVEIDWGDGTIENKGSTSYSTYPHTYSAIGDYIITLEPLSGTITVGSSTSSSGSAAATSHLFYYTNSANTFSYNYLKRVELGNSVILKNYVFQFCYSLANITIPKSVTSIGNYIFNDCRSLATITIPESATSIGNHAFQGCYSLTSINIPESVTDIETNTYSNCYSLISITIPENVTSIAAYAFQNCYSLATITIPENVTSIGKNAFQNCYSLISITIPENITSIESYIFQDCYSLTSINIPENVTSIGAYAFAYCYSLTSITIPESVTDIGNYAFTYCYSLANIIIPESVTDIGTYVFQHCDLLTNITISENITNITTYAFSYCYSLTNITIPENVTRIAAYAFRNCYGIKEIHFLKETPPTITSTSFNSMPSDYIIYVPYSEDHSILAAYQSATNWSSIKSHIQEEPQN